MASPAPGPDRAPDRTPSLPRPGVVRSVTFLIASFPLRIVQFVLLVVGVGVGVATTIIWIGIPVLILTTTLVLGLADLERRWVRTMLHAPLPLGPRLIPAGSLLRRWRDQVTDPATWRAVAYFLISLPLGAVEFAFAVAGIVVVPVGIWVVPWLAWIHGRLAMALLGPNRTEQLARQAEHLQASRARGVNAAEAERRRIERDLHDGAQQRLVAVAMTLGRAKAKFDADPIGARVLLDEAHADAKLAVSELRDLARGIYPAVLGDRGLDAALSSLAARAPIPVRVQVDLHPRPADAVETTAYFIVGEALTNVAKHAGAGAAEVRVWRAGDTVVVEVTDDGTGGATIRPGGGLAGLADRAATIDGVVTVVSPTGGPTVLRADLPCVW